MELTCVDMGSPPGGRKVPTYSVFVPNIRLETSDLKFKIANQTVTELLWF